MAYLLGEQVQVGVGVEDTRGTGVTAQSWIPSRSPTGITSIVERTNIQETRGTGINSFGSELTQLRAEGDLEFNVRHTSIGYLLKSLLGSVDSSEEATSGAYTHTFTRMTSGPQLPSLTLVLAQEGFQDYEYPLTVVNSLEIQTPVDDVVNATANFIASKEEEHADFTPAFDESSDFLFRNHDVTIKFADTLDNLDGASGVCIKEFSASISNNARPNQCIGGLNPSDIFTLITEISGSFVADFEDPADYYDVFKSSGYKAMRIEMERDDMDELGSASGLYPKIQIDLPKVSFSGYTPERPIDDIVTESIEYVGHYDSDEGEAIIVTIQNEQENYDAA